MLGALLSVEKKMGSECTNLRDDIFDAIADFVVCDPQEVDVKFVFQNVLAVSVASPNAVNVMNTAVYFDCEFETSAIEVKSKRADNLLTPEMQPATTMVSQALPEVVFRRGRQMSCLPGKRSQHLPHWFFHESVS